MLIEKLKQKFNELKREGKTEETIFMALKEELIQYLLHYIYTSKEYSSLIMYGGTALRIGFDLPRMSEDLDFQTDKRIDLTKFAKDIEKYFLTNYMLVVETKIRTNPNEGYMDVVFIKFDILKEFEFKSVKMTKLFVKLDINHFNKASSFVNILIPGGKGTDLQYNIKTYPLSTLMASKTAAFLQRDSRGIGNMHTNVKPRDVYDMMWYMNQKIMPDLEYLKVKGIEFNSFLDFRDKVKVRAEKIEDKAFLMDLSQLFFDKNELESWMSNWRSSFMLLLDFYKVFKVGELESIYLYIDFNSENRSIIYHFSSLESETKVVNFKVLISENWFIFHNLQAKDNHNVKEIEDKISKNAKRKLTNIDYNYIGLFYQKIQDYIKRTNNVVYQRDFVTKLIRVSADNIDPIKQICLDPRLLEKIQFEELL